MRNVMMYQGPHSALVCQAEFLYGKTTSLKEEPSFYVYILLCVAVVSIPANIVCVCVYIYKIGRAHV
jgi:hypothetical protein